MTSSLLSSDHNPPPLWAGGDEPPAQPPPRPTRRRRRRGAPLATLLAASALLGGGVSAGILEATGAVGGSKTSTTVIERTADTASASSSSSSSGAGLDAEALYASTSAGVVDITVHGTSTDQAQSPFGGVPQQSEQTATGTGFEVDTQGHIVTAAHVVDGATSVTVKLQDGRTRKATVLGVDDATDIAVIRIDPSGLTLRPLALGSSASLPVGASVAAIGDPFGYDRSISTGIVSGVDRTIQAPNGFTVAHAIQTDAAINPGNSGGPVLDASGRVIGIADQIATDGTSDQSSGVGFAVPIDLVKSALKTLEAGGTVRHAYLGVATGDSTSGTGASISSVAGGGPAASGGLRSGDVITALGGRTVTDSNGLVAAIATHQPGDKVQVTVRRGSSTLHLTVTLGSQPAQSSNG